MAERETEDEVKNMVAAEALGITSNVLTEIGRNIGDPKNKRTVQHHGGASIEGISDLVSSLIVPSS